MKITIMPIFFDMQPFRYRFRQGGPDTLELWEVHYNRNLAQCIQTLRHCPGFISSSMYVILFHSYASLMTCHLQGWIVREFRVVAFQHVIHVILKMLARKGPLVAHDVKNDFGGPEIIESFENTLPGYIDWLAAPPVS